MKFVWFTSFIKFNWKQKQTVQHKILQNLKKIEQRCIRNILNHCVFLLGKEIFVCNIKKNTIRVLARIVAFDSKRLLKPTSFLILLMASCLFIFLNFEVILQFYIVNIKLNILRLHIHLLKSARATLLRRALCWKVR